MTRWLKRKPLSIGDIKDFKAWKQDLMEAWAAMGLPIEDYQSTVNHLIMTRLDSDIHATVVNLLPQDKEELVAWKPEALFQQIKERLVNMDQAEHRRLRFELAKQRMEEDPLTYESRVRRYYEKTPLKDEEQFIKKYTRSVYNKALGKLLTMHKLLLVTIESLKIEIQYYVTQLLIYAETTPDAEPATIAGLGGMRYGLDGERKETMRQMRALYHP